LLLHISTPRKREKSAERKIDASDMLYLIMPDRFANGNQKTIAMLLQKENTIAIYPAEDTAATFKG
jgi:hypothetical protein